MQKAIHMEIGVGGGGGGRFSSVVVTGICTCIQAVMKAELYRTNAVARYTRTCTL